jgi:hypothetical protein
MAKCSRNTSCKLMCAKRHVLFSFLSFVAFHFVTFDYRQYIYVAILSEKYNVFCINDSLIKMIDFLSILLGNLSVLPNVNCVIYCNLQYWSI